MRYLIGAGSHAASDDGIGLRVAEKAAVDGLEAAHGFRAVALRGGWIDLLACFEEGTERILVVDSARMGLAPGSVKFFSPEEARSVKVLGGAETHGGDLFASLELAKATGAAIPPLEFMGIEPYSVEPGMSLSPELEARLGEYLSLAVARLGSRPGGCGACPSRA
ncbi:MAG: hydrogenase maturation protease [Elusimicrobia bacterium]|nr:hydrogenase maturation protease [Elusimicrobiota bacterium]